VRVNNASDWLPSREAAIALIWGRCLRRCSGEKLASDRNSRYSAYLDHLTANGIPARFVPDHVVTFTDERLAKLLNSLSPTSHSKLHSGTCLERDQELNPQSQLHRKQCCLTVSICHKDKIDLKTSESNCNLKNYLADSRFVPPIDRLTFNGARGAFLQSRPRISKKRKPPYRDEIATLAVTS
jgi:hypothetical protein